MGVPFSIYKDGDFLSNQKGHTNREKSLRNKLMEITTEPKTLYLLYKYKMGSCQTWEELKTKYFSAYANDFTEEKAETRFSSEEDFQKAEKYLLKILHTKELIQLYKVYLSKAQDDVSCFKAFLDFSDRFFANEKENELTKLLNNIDLGDLDE